jgi:cob(I)alamin adenosyltransferase
MEGIRMKAAPRILVFTGDGKGKTTAALGMALRAVGHGLPTLIVQFIKADDSTGELPVLKTMAGVEIRQVGLGFVPRADSAAFADHKQAAVRGLEEATRDLASGKYRLVILDEICGAAAKGLVPEESVVAAVRQAPSETIVVLTGRHAGTGLIELADTVTEMRCVRHGHQRGLKAQRGVEF